jgi:hypothetical protein
MRGLDPRIHAALEARMPDFGANGATWMTGSSPVMTICDCMFLRDRRL